MITDGNVSAMRSKLGRYRRRVVGIYERLLGIPLARALAEFRQADLAIFFNFHPAPYGGGNQFLKALWQELERRDLKLENNNISHTTRACLFSSYNFDFDRLRGLHRKGLRMVHRVDGPLGVYRGRDDGSDQRIWGINQELADTTIFQSHYSLEKHIQLGMEFKSPRVIKNACDERIFHPHGRIEFDPGRKIRLISTSWSPNLNKGAPVYKWIEEHLDWDRFEYSFVGNSPIHFDRIRMIPPVPSNKLAEILRQHDIYVTASQNDPCSNALIEALSCGLPALYLQSGGHAEIVGQAGLGFSDQKDIPDLLDQLVFEHPGRQAEISLPSLSRVTDRYLEVMGVEP